MAKTNDGGERANVAQDRMLATLSHEIRTPLNGVMGMAGLLATTRLDETQAAYLETLRACGEHLLNLVNDVLDLAKLDAGRVEFEPAETDVEGLLQGVAELLSPTAHAGGVEIAWWVGPAVPVLLTDDGRLRQILFNLAGNAVKFAKAGGVTLSAGVVARHPAGVRVRFDVADTGPGLEAEAQATVFGEFVQTEAGVRAGGAGLGLAIVKRLADAFGGRVGVESEPGAGAVFWFEADFVAVDQPAANPSLAGLTVGVASPSPIVRAAAARQIEACGGRPVCAETAKALPERTQIVLIDGAAARVRPCKGVPSLILLAPEARRRIGPARAAGFAGYLIKPLRRQSVADRIRAVLGEAPAPSPHAVFEDERAGASEKTSGARVLLVEDNPVNALLAKALLAREGCLVDRAATGEEALQAAAQVPYDLILMDLRMPDMDGLAAARALRARGVRIPIVALTANGFQEDRRACLAAGMDDFLTKPLSPHALVTALRRWTTPRPPTEAAA